MHEATSLPSLTATSACIGSVASKARPGHLRDLGASRSARCGHRKHVAVQSGSTGSLVGARDGTYCDCRGHCGLRLLIGGENRGWLAGTAGSTQSCQIACSAATTCAPSPRGRDALDEPARTSPIAKTPRRLVSSMRSALPLPAGEHESLGVKPIPEPLSQSVFGCAPMNRNRWRFRAARLASSARAPADRLQHAVLLQRDLRCA